MEKDTMAYQLAVLRDTQMVQRRQLEAMYPYIDWSKMPFSSYGDFFRLRSIIEDCGEVWTNAYGRSNEEDASMRKYLKDYSGKGRDIELFNFGYSKQSGFNGYVQDFRLVGSHSENVQFDESSFNIPINETPLTWHLMYDISAYNNHEWALNIHLSGNGIATLVFYHQNGDDTVIDKEIYFSEGVNVIPQLTEISASTEFAFSANTGSGVTAEQLPFYRGAIVSDGVDDHGVCTKDFALPDDYTVVAMRELLNSAGLIVGKASSTTNGAFLFEPEVSSNFSYGTNTVLSGRPLLFSYQTKSEYNGQPITPGESEDSEENPLRIFHNISSTKYRQAALYSFGIFNRTLTADELRTVENCMYAEWIYMTGKLEDLEYYDILDARFRSNDEAADKRSKWVGRFGKLHMTLHNYGYSQMSGWGGYPIKPFSDINQASGSEATPTKVKVTKIDSNGWVYRMGVSEILKTQNWRLKIHNPSGKSLFLYYLDPEGTSVQYKVPLFEGINTIPAYSEDFSDMLFGMSAFSIGEYIEVEQIPLYGGALVSDGVDDYAVSDEVIDEEIGGVVMLAEKISDPATSYGNVFSSSVGLGGSTGKEIAGLVSKGSDSIIMGDPWTSFGKNEDAAYGLDRSPIAPNNKLMVGNNNSHEWGNAALYQLRLIKTQPTDIQLEAIKWQCRKEHEDYLIHRGWKEIG